MRLLRYTAAPYHVLLYGYMDDMASSLLGLTTRIAYRVTHSCASFLKKGLSHPKKQVSVNTN